MKKIVLSVSLLLAASASVFGANANDQINYNGYSISSTMALWIVIAIVVFFILALLGIILFFKIWGMTNNTKTLRIDVQQMHAKLDALQADMSFQKEVGCSSVVDDGNLMLMTQKLHLIGKDDIAYEILNNSYLKAIDEVCVGISQGKQKTDEGKKLYYNRNRKEYEPAERVFAETLDMALKVKNIAPCYTIVGKEIPAALKNISLPDLALFYNIQL